jgi:uncharacterized protein YbaR (Trm112 family)
MTATVKPGMKIIACPRCHAIMEYKECSRLDQCCPQCRYRLDIPPEYSEAVALLRRPIYEARIRAKKRGLVETKSVPIIFQPIDLEGSHGPVPSLQARCSKCSHIVHAFGQSPGSEKYAYMEMAKSCPLREKNFYVKGNRRVLI